MLYELSNDPLAEFVPTWILEETRVHIKVPQRVCVNCPKPMSRRPWSGGLTKIGSNPGPRDIELHPDYYQRCTATGEALRAHEYFHVWQRSVVPDFDQAFTREAIRTENLGLPPWENGFERPAYQFEQQVKERLLERGYPLSYGF